MRAIPRKYVSRQTMLDAGWDQVACRRCSETVWWFWRDGDSPDHCNAVLVCKNCGHLSPPLDVGLEVPMATAPDSVGPDR